MGTEWAATTSPTATATSTTPSSPPSATTSAASSGGSRFYCASCWPCSSLRQMPCRPEKTILHRRRISRGIWQRTPSMLDQLNLRFKYIFAFLIGAVITAAALRHGVHVYGGFSREEIRTGALMAIPFVALAALFFRRNR